MVTASMLTSQATHVPHGIPSLSTDAIILLVVVVVMAYALMVNLLPLSRLAAGVYIGLVLASTFGDSVSHYSHSGPAGGSGLVNTSSIHLALLVLPMVLIQIGHPIRSRIHKANFIVLLLLGLMTALLIITAGLSVLDNATLQSALSQSNLASQIYNLRLPLLAITPLAMSAAALFHRHPRGH